MTRPPAIGATRPRSPNDGAGGGVAADQHEGDGLVRPDADQHRRQGHGMATFCWQDSSRCGHSRPAANAQQWRCVCSAMCGVSQVVQDIENARPSIHLQSTDRLFPVPRICPCRPIGLGLTTRLQMAGFWSASRRPLLSFSQGPLPPGGGHWVVPRSLPSVPATTTAQHRLWRRPARRIGLSSANCGYTE